MNIWKLNSQLENQFILMEEKILFALDPVLTALTEQIDLYASPAFFSLVGTCREYTIAYAVFGDSSC
uniref:Transcriptional regulator n=1 Tax=Heterorhabditis bacteriophora TaxID=37862 RepID=A0A1I7X0I8_HETBA